MDLCIECLNDPSLYRSEPETPSLAKKVLTIKVDDNIGPNMVELTRRQQIFTHRLEFTCKNMWVNEDESKMVALDNDNKVY